MIVRLIGSRSGASVGVIVGYPKKKRRAKAVFLFMASAIALTGVTPVYAQSTATQIEIRQIDLPAGPLGDTLVVLGEIFGINIIAPDRLIASKSSPAVSGSMTAEEALSRVLAGSGLEAQSSEDGAFIVAAIDPGAAASTSEERDEIIVRGTKRDLSIQKTQTSVSVFTDEQIEDRVIFNLDDVLLRTPNISTAQGVQRVSIRGISILGIGDLGASDPRGNTANIYVDNAPVSFSGRRVAFNLWDVDQVEVLRGPQSTIQGRNALSGAIMLQTADPDYEFGAEARAAGGNQEYRQFSGTLNLPILKDQIALRFAADYRETDFGIVNAGNGEKALGEESLMLRGKLLFEPAFLPNLRLEFGVQHAETQTGPQGQVFPPDVFGTPGFDAFDPFGNVSFDPFLTDRDVSSTRGVLNIEYELTPNWKLISIGTYEESEDTSLLSGAVDGRDVAIEDTLSIEIRTAFEYERFRGWIGGYYFNEERTQTSTDITDLGAFGIITNPPGGLVSRAVELKRETDNYAFFGDVTFDVTDRLHLNFGARVDREEIFDTGRQGTVTASTDPCTIVAPFLIGSPCTAVRSATSDPAATPEFTVFLPRGGVTYDFDDLRSLSFTVARGYRAGGAFTSGTEILEFDPEFITNYEIALRSLWMDERLAFNANAFYSDVSEQQLRIQDPSGSLSVLFVNAGSSELFGAEFSLDFAATDTLNLFGSLGLLQTEFNDFEFIRGAGEPFENLAGNEFPSAPNVTAAAGFAYEHPFGFFSSANMSYASRQFSDVENIETDKADNRFLVNSRVGYRTDHVQISVFANNLFNERFTVARTTQSADNTGTVVNDSSPLFTVNNPRQFGVELRARY